MSSQCPIHPYDRKPFAAHPNHVRQLVEVAKTGKWPALTDNGYADADHTKRMERLDAALAAVEVFSRGVDVPVIIEILPNGVYQTQPLREHP